MRGEQTVTPRKAALAISIIKELRDWRKRALDAEKRVEEIQTSLPDLAELNQATHRSIPQSSINWEDKKATLAEFLKNIHAIRAAQNIPNVCNISLVDEFVRKSLLKLSTGKLRRAYCQHSTEYIDLRCSSHDTEVLRRVENLVEYLIGHIEDSVSKIEAEGAAEFLTDLCDAPHCSALLMRSLSGNILKTVQSVSRSAFRLKESKAIQELSECSEFVKEAQRKTEFLRQLFVLQERGLENCLSWTYTDSEFTPFTPELLELIVKSAVQAQQYVEILEVYSPDIAEMLYASTALILVTLQRIGSEENFANDRSAQRTVCIQLSKSIQDIYMPRSANRF